MFDAIKDKLLTAVRTAPDAHVHVRHLREASMSSTPRAAAAAAVKREQHFEPLDDAFLRFTDGLRLIAVTALKLKTNKLREAFGQLKSKEQRPEVESKPQPPQAMPEAAAVEQKSVVQKKQREVKFE